MHPECHFIVSEQPADAAPPTVWTALSRAAQPTIHAAYSHNGREPCKLLGTLAGVYSTS